MDLDLEPYFINPNSLRVKGYRTALLIKTEEVLEVLHNARKLLETTGNGSSHKFGSYSVKVSTPRILTYTKGTTCEICQKTEVVFFAVQRNGGKWHLNAWGWNGSAFVLMTSDHIIPLNKGGPNSLDNRQCACGPCNWRKRDTMPDMLASPAAQVLENMKTREDREREWIQQYTYHPNDTFVVRKTKRRIIQAFTTFQQRFLEYSGGQLPHPKLRRILFMQPFDFPTIQTALDHTEQEWPCSEEYMINLLKAVRMASNTAYELVKLSALYDQESV